MTTVPSSAAMTDPFEKPSASGHQGEDGRHGRHEDRPDAGPAALDERVVGGIALVPQLLHEVQQHDGVGDHDADEHQEPDEGADADGLARDEQRREGADGRERQAEQDDQRVDQRPEQEHHHEVDEQDGHAHRQEQAAERLALLLRGARQLDGHARGDGATGLELGDPGGDGLVHGTLVVGDEVAADGRRWRAIHPRHGTL